MKIFLMFLIFLISCSHQPIKYFDKSYLEINKEIPYDFEFGYLLDGVKYNYGRVVLQEGEQICSYFLGYKNGELKYQFTLYDQKELINIFKEKNALRMKTRRLQTKIEELNLMSTIDKSKSKSYCKKKNVIGDVAEMMSYSIVFSPFLIVLSPVIVPAAAYDSFQSNEIFKNLKSVFFGQTVLELEKNLGLPNRQFTKEGYSILSYSWNLNEPVFANYFFEEGKLVGFVSGKNIEPQTVIEQTR